MTNRRWYRWLSIVAAVVVSALGMGADADAGPVSTVDDIVEPTWTLPNLVPDVAFVSIQESKYDEATGTFVAGPPQLFFDTYTQNLGAWALELTADDPTSLDTSQVSQCVVWAAEHACRERRTVGGFLWHDAHGHYHFEDFASYSLRRVAKNGQPIWSKRGLVSVSDKVSFCMMDTAQVEFSFPGFLLGFYSRCTPTIQGISAGWLDVYSAGLPGQQLPLNGIRDGRYALVVDLDSADRLHESDEGDNVLVATVEISGGGTQVRIVDKRYP